MRRNRWDRLYYLLLFYCDSLVHRNRSDELYSVIWPYYGNRINQIIAAKSEMEIRCQARKISAISIYFLVLNEFPAVYPYACARHGITVYSFELNANVVVAWLAAAGIQV